MGIPNKVPEDLRFRIIKKENHGINGYRVDTHFHTPFSKDFIATVKYKMLMYKALKKASETLDVINITDHNTVSGIEKAIEIAEKNELPLEILKGCEFNTDVGHVTAFGIEDFKYFKKKFPKNLSNNGSFIFHYIDVIKIIKDAGGFVIFPHPVEGKGVFGKSRNSFYRSNHSTLGVIEKFISYVDFLELFDSYFSKDDLNRQRDILTKVYSLSNRYGPNLVVGGDSHEIESIGNAYTLIEKNGIPNIKELMIKYPNKMFFYNKFYVEQK